jgi:hypothetical protein
MALTRKGIYLAWFSVHFVLLFVVSSRQALSVVAQGGTLLPRSWDSGLARAEEAETLALGEKFASANPLRQAIFAYTRSAGIETGYGFFAPSVSAVRKLVFEIRYADGRVEYELPRVGDPATGLRLILLFENLERVTYQPLREMMFKMMAFSVWREHTDAIQIRAVFGYVNLPSISEFERNEQASYEVLFAYDFFPPEPPASQ